MLGATLLIPAAERAVRHVDARTSQEELPSPIALLAGYSSLASELLSGSYSSASGLVSYMDSSYVPGSVRYIFSRFNALLGSAISDLNMTDALVQEAKRALSIGMVGEAKSLAGNASASLWRANVTASQVQESADAVASKLRAPQVRAAVIGALESRIALLAQEISALRSEIYAAESGSVVGTRITFSLAQGEAWVGSPVAAYGALTTEEGVPIAGETVHVSVPGAAPYQAVTGADGGYSVAFSAPHLYVDSVNVYAYYLAPQPGEGDAAYGGSRSPDAALSLLWVEPRVSVLLNATRAKPGDRVLVSGIMDAGEQGGGAAHGAAGLGVKISAFGSSSTVWAEGGRFSAVVQVPPNASGGVSLVSAAAIPSGIIGPASASAALEVYRLPTAVTLDLPSVAISGTSLVVSGRVFSPADGSPIPGASVSVTVSGSSAPPQVAHAGEDGSFSVEVPAGLEIPTGWAAVTPGTPRCGTEPPIDPEWAADGW